MKRLLLVAATLNSVALSPLAYAQDAPALVLGAGTKSCGYWLSNPSNKFEGEVWILGFWSGINVGSPMTRMVGKTTDAQGILAGVEKVCDDDPAQELITAVISLHHELAQQDR